MQEETDPFFQEYRDDLHRVRDAARAQSARDRQSNE